ncbi:MAG: LapA family protein [Gammaproteobacteria bacterium]|nr:LapA family protein [Gammaproteobacteria bacterium]
MAWFKAFLSFALALLVILCGIVLTLRNGQMVELNLVLWQSPSLSLGILVVVSLLVGCLLGMLINSLWLWRVTRKSQKLQKQLDQSIKRLEQLQ